jgi:hypothetical protein
VQGLPKKFDQKKILKVIKKKFACNGTIVSDAEMGEVVQLQGDQRKDVQDFLTDKKEGLGLEAKTIKVSHEVRDEGVFGVCADKNARSTVSSPRDYDTSLRVMSCCLSSAAQLFGSLLAHGRIPVEKVRWDMKFECGYAQ